jgi:hypothetical protein
MMAWLRDRVGSTGRTPEAVAEAVFRVLEAGRFWILTHLAEFDTLIERRARMLTGHTPPELRQLV